MPLLRGRAFQMHDEPANCTLISAGLAARVFAPGSDPIGKTLFLGNGQRRVVVGVVGDVRQTSLGAPETPTLYFPTTWYLWPTMSIVVRSGADPAALIEPMRAVARRTAPEHPLFAVRTLVSALDASVAEQRLQMYVIALFAIASLLLAAIGIAGVMSYLLVRRTPELALRMAMGASRSAATQRILRRGAALCAAGVVLGFGLAIVAGKWLPSSSPSASTPFSVMLALALLMFAIGTLASWWPLRRIGSISPGQLLRGGQ